VIASNTGSAMALLCPRDQYMLLTEVFARVKRDPDLQLGLEQQ